MILPWHSHIPEPKYISLIKNQKIFIDVGTLLRGSLFPSSHSLRLFEHIEWSNGAKGLFSPHVRNKAIAILQKYYPLLVEKFSSNLLLLIKRGILGELQLSRNTGQATGHYGFGNN